MSEQNVEARIIPVRCDGIGCKNLIYPPRPIKLSIRKNDEGLKEGYYYFCSQDCLHDWSM